jgi:hypothetical protein
MCRMQRGYDGSLARSTGLALDLRARK